MMTIRNTGLAVLAAIGLCCGGCASEREHHHHHDHGHRAAARHASAVHTNCHPLPPPKSVKAPKQPKAPLPPPPPKR